MRKRKFKKLAACSVAFLLIAFFAGTWARAQFPGMAPPKHYPWSDTSLSPDQRADLVIKEMTLDEKIQLLHGMGWQAIFAPAESGPGTRAVSASGLYSGCSAARHSRSADDGFGGRRLGSGSEGPLCDGIALGGSDGGGVGSGALL